MRRLTLLLGVLLLQLAASQQLAVQGSYVSGGVAFNLGNTAYAPAEPLAQAIGAEYVFDPERQLAIFQLGGRVITLQVYSSEAEAGRSAPALRIDGREVNSFAGLNRNGTVFVPVRDVALAFGGSTAYIPEPSTVIVNFPRATLQSVALNQHDGYERLELNFDAITPFTIEQQQDFIYIYFTRAYLERANQTAGALMTNAAWYPGPNHVVLRLSLARDASYDVIEFPQGEGVQVVIDAFSEMDVARQTEVLRVVLDPVGGVGESELSLALAERVGAQLARRGFAVEFTREEDALLPVSLRTNRGIGADLFVSLAPTSLPAGHLNIYYLSDASNLDTLNMAIRQNLELSRNLQLTDGLRRQLLMGFVPDLNRGENYASTIANTLRQRFGYTVERVAGAPLYVLGGAAGRGVLIELSLLEAQNPERLSGLADALAESLHALLTR